MTTTAIAFAITLATLSHAATGCESPGETVSVVAAGSGSVLSWQPTPAATAYRARIQSRVPNGRVVASQDSVVRESRISTQQPLADYRAKVTARLTAICGDATGKESVSWSVIETAGTCTEGQREVRRYSLAEGRLLTIAEAKSVPHIEGTHPICGATRGEAAYRVVSN